MVQKKYGNEPENQQQESQSSTAMVLRTINAAILLQRMIRRRRCICSELENRIKTMSDVLRKYCIHLDRIVGLRGSKHLKIDLQTAAIRTWLDKLKNLEDGLTWVHVPKTEYHVREIFRLLCVMMELCGAPSIVDLLSFVTAGVELSPEVTLALSEYDHVLYPLEFSKTIKPMYITSRIELEPWVSNETPSIQLSGALIRLPIGCCEFEIRGILPHDPDQMLMSYYSRRHYQQLLSVRIRDVQPRLFSVRFLEEMLIRDRMTWSRMRVIEHVQESAKLLRQLEGKPLLEIMSDFVEADLKKKRQIIVLMTLGSATLQRQVRLLTVAMHLSQTNRKCIQFLKRYVSSRVHQLLFPAEDEQQQIIKAKPPSYEERIQLLACSEDVRQKAMDRLATMRGRDTDGKAKQYLDGLLRIPFGKYREEEIFRLKSADVTEKKFDQSELNQDARQKRMTFINIMRDTLDRAAYGQVPMKRCLIRLMARWITGPQTGAVLGLKGPPGVGKTSLIKNGLAECWKDADGKPRPFFLVPLGGTTRSSSLIGHGYTYSGSTWGRIVSIIQQAGVLNPIILFDELDKVSASPYGNEIIGVLTHLTDSTQNTEFYDRYFDGVPIDLSRAVFIFSFNDESKIDPILLDRMTVIEASPLYSSEKLVIAQDYAWPEIMQNLGYGKNDITLPESVASMIVHRYTREAGVRRMKQMLTELGDEINLRRMLGSQSSEWPIVIDDESAQSILGQQHLAVPKPRIAELPMPGMIHGMYATKSGIGGVLMIEVYPIDGEKDRVTGSLGDVMKESVECASSLARKLLSEPTKQAVHIHIPEAATPKDGPSAGTALALALWSCWTKTALNHRISITGEVDLSGKVRSIGGLEQKICGALRAGMNRVAVPRSNKPRVEQLFKKKRFSDVVRRDQVCFIGTIQEAMELFTRDIMFEASQNLLTNARHKGASK